MKRLSFSDYIHRIGAEDILGPWIYRGRLFIEFLKMKRIRPFSERPALTLRPYGPDRRDTYRPNVPAKFHPIDHVPPHHYLYLRASPFHKQPPQPLSGYTMICS